MNTAPARPVSRDLATGNDVGVLVRRCYRAAIPDPLLGPTQIDRWIELWEETVDEFYVGRVADHTKARAREVARALRAVARRQQAGATQ